MFAEALQVVWANVYAEDADIRVGPPPRRGVQVGNAKPFFTALGSAAADDSDSGDGLSRQLLDSWLGGL